MKNNKKGFTLIELLVVIAIIGLLSTLAVVSLNNARIKARDARRQSDLKQISTAMELYMSQKDIYPTNNTDCTTAGRPGRVAGAEAASDLEPLCYGPGMSVCADNTSPADSDCLDTEDATFLNAIPADPTNSGNYVYRYEGSGTTYCIQATLEGTSGAYFLCVNGSCYQSTSACNPS